MVVVDPRFFHSTHGALQCAIDRYRQHSAPSWTDDEDVRWTAMDPRKHRGTDEYDSGKEMHHAQSTSEVHFFVMFNLIIVSDFL